MGGNWVSHSVNKCWLSPSGLGCSCWNSKNSPGLGSNIFGLYGAGSLRCSVYSQCGLKSLSVCLLHMWICSTDVSWLPGRQALLPLAFLALVVTWWHTVASGVQTGSARANTIHSSTSLALFKTFRDFKTDDRGMILENVGFLIYCNVHTDIFRICELLHHLLPLVFWQINQVGTCSRWEVVATETH